MQIFVSEYLCGGALFDDTLPESMSREGLAMLSSVIADLQALPDCRVVTTLDRRVADSFASNDESLSVELIDDASEQRVFEELVVQADATLVIAPETGGVLARRVQRVIELNGRSLNCRPDAIELCGDKLRLAEHLITRGIATLPTQRCSLHGPNPWDIFESACVVKPRDGAGSWLTFGIVEHDRVAWDRAKAQFIAAGLGDRAVVQPWVPGQALSVGCFCDPSGHMEMLPIAAQEIRGDTFCYRGGRIPANLPDAARANIERLVRSCACTTIPGLRGYIGIDVLLPDRHPESPLIVEINPRLTTSYVGYRQLCDDNIAERWLSPDGLSSPLKIRIGEGEAPAEPRQTRGFLVTRDLAGASPSFFQGAIRRLLRWKPNAVVFEANGQIVLDHANSGI